MQAHIQHHSKLSLLFWYFLVTDTKRPLSSRVVAQLSFVTIWESSVSVNDLFKDDFNSRLALWDELSKFELLLSIHSMLRSADNKGSIFMDDSSLLNGIVKLLERVSLQAQHKHLTMLTYQKSEVQQHSNFSSVEHQIRHFQIIVIKYLSSL